MNQQRLKFLLMAVIGCFVNIHFSQAQDNVKVNPAQLTFFYPVGTHGAASDSISNHFSVNLIWGSTGGVKGLELGGLINQTSGSVKGLQAAGLGNLNATDLSGAQLGGLVNVTLHAFKGFQAAGLLNLAEKGTNGGDSLSTFRSSSSGVQLSGMLNINSNQLDGAQFAGVANFQGDSLKGIQLAGVINSSYYTQGVQVSGLVNRTKVLSGVQFGIINIADTVRKGIQVGLINIVKHGYRAMEVEFNESFYANLNYKMGSERFYSIFSLAFKEQDGNRFWAPGFGFGSSWRIGKKAGLNIDALHYQVNEDEWWTDELNILDKLKLNGSYQITKHLTVYSGASLNVQVSRIKNAEGTPKGSVFNTPETFYDEVHGKTRVIIYPGLNIGIRL